jgi:hypothetical protein
LKNYDIIIIEKVEKEVFFMGLDFSIEIRIKDKQTKEVTSIEAAYWRKCYGIRDEVMDAALHSNLILKYNEDYYLRVKAEAIEAINDRLIQTLSDKEVLEHSIWGYTSTRRQTLLNLEDLFEWENFIQEFLSAKVDGRSVEMDSDNKALCAQLTKCIAKYNSAYGAHLDVDLPVKVFANPANYKISIEINNSY